jgi:cysteine desulfurase
MFGFFARLFAWRRPVRRIHLDYASGTPVHPTVLRVMQPYFNKVWANPSALYQEGIEAQRAVAHARTRIAQTLRVRPHDVTFTSGGTEANNLALIGLVEKLHADGRPFADMEIITTHIEHPSILEAAAMLAARGVQITYVPVHESGLIDIATLKTLLTEKTVLVTCAYVNSEIGVIQDVKKITRTVRAWNTAHAAHVRVHVDGCQAPLWLSCAMDMLGADLLTLDAGKCSGPKGVGLLIHRRQTPLTPISFGGGQESGLRSGTENVPLIVGCAEALVRAQKGYEERSKKVAELRDYFFTLLETQVPECVVNGDREHRVANNVHVSIPGYDSDYVVIWLDAHGVAASTKSACGVGNGNGSSVVRALTHDEDRARSTIRFTLAETTTRREVEMATSLLATHVRRMRSVSSIHREH